MKRLGVVSTAVLLLALGPVSGLAQQPDEGKPPRQEDGKPQHPQQREEHPQEREQPREQPRSPQDNQRRAEDNARQAQDNDRIIQEQQRNAQENSRRIQEENQNRAQQEQKSQQDQMRQNQKIQEQNARSEQKAREEDQKRDQRDRERQARDNDRYTSGGHPEPQGLQTAYHGRIPEERFHEHFGREHYFRVHRPVIIDNRPRFQYSGYWFELVDPWPSAWSYDDDVYVDYVGDQYYLYDPAHPGMEILISVVF